MKILNEEDALNALKNISYYRLKGYWWDMQSNFEQHFFKSGSYFEDVIDRYNFDRELRLILFDAIEHIEIALRTKMIYHLSLKYVADWYLQKELFSDIILYKSNLKKLKAEFEYSQEIFIQEHKEKYPEKEPESWKILEIASLGTLSKIYKSINHQLPEKTIIAKEFGLNNQKELSSWIESIVYMRNIIAHHSRLWSRNMVKRPIVNIKPKIAWFDTMPSEVQIKKPFIIISCMIYLCDFIIPKNKIKSKILELISKNQNIPIYKIGF